MRHHTISCSRGRTAIDDMFGYNRSRIVSLLKLMLIFLSICIYINFEISQQSYVSINPVAVYNKVIVD